MKKLFICLRRSSVRPLIYMTCNRFVISLALSLLADRLIRHSPSLPFLSYLFTFLCVLFGLLAWIAYLRFDGIRLPKPFMKRFHFKKKPMRTYGDIADHTDDPITTFDDLEDDEKDACCFTADIICCAAYLLLALSIAA